MRLTIPPVVLALLSIVPAWLGPAAWVEGASLPDFDRRSEVQVEIAPPAATARTNAETRLQERRPGVRIDRSFHSGGARWVTVRDGFLTGPDGRGGAMAGASPHGIATNDSHRIVKEFLAEHAAVFGHDHTALDSARLTRDAIAPH